MNFSIYIYISIYIEPSSRLWPKSAHHCCMGLLCLCVYFAFCLLLLSGFSFIYSHALWLSWFCLRSERVERMCGMWNLERGTCRLFCSFRQFGLAVYLPLLIRKIFLALDGWRRMIGKAPGPGRLGNSGRIVDTLQAFVQISVRNRRSALVQLKSKKKISTLPHQTRVESEIQRERLIKRKAATTRKKYFLNG